MEDSTIITDIGWTIGYLVFVCWLYFFHSPLRERTTAERSEWYAQLMKIIQVWCMVHITFFHLMGHYLDERKEVGPSAVFFPLLAIFLSFFGLFHREKRRLSMGITYGATTTMLLMNSLITSFGLTLHFATCSFQSTFPHVPVVSQIFCPPYDPNRPVAIISHLSILGVSFILGDYYFKRYHHFNVGRSILWSVSYDLKPTRAAGMAAISPIEHGSWNQSVHEPGAEPQGEPMVEWYAASAAGVGLNLAFGSAIHNVTVDYRAIEAAISPKFFMFGQPPAVAAPTKSKNKRIEDQTTDDDAEPDPTTSKKTTLMVRKAKKKTSASREREEATTAGLTKKGARTSLARSPSPTSILRTSKPSEIRRKIFGKNTADVPPIAGGAKPTRPVPAFPITAPESDLEGVSSCANTDPTPQTAISAATLTTIPDSADDDVWFDFVADIGDGFNSTYEISRLLAQPMLRVSTSAATQFSLSRLTAGARERWIKMSRRGLFGAVQRRSSSTYGATGGTSSEGQSTPTDASIEFRTQDAADEAKKAGKQDSAVDLPRGTFLVIGGDLAYPTPTASVWQSRFFDVYAQALPRSFATKIHERQQCPRVQTGPTLNPPSCGFASLGRNRNVAEGRGVKEGMEAGYIKEAKDGDFPNTPHSRGRSQAEGKSPPGSTPNGRSPTSASTSNVQDHQVISAPIMFAIPGNHDWFDGCGTFRNFILSKSWCGGWFMPQKTTYFAISLTQDWFLFGLDNALSDDIDPDQLVYFLMLVEKNLTRLSSVIIVTHEPAWLNDHINVAEGEPHTQQRTQKLINVLGNRLRLRLAGDIHNYSRYSPQREGDTKKTDSAAATLPGSCSDDPGKATPTPGKATPTDTKGFVFPATPAGVSNTSISSTTSHFTSADLDSPANTNCEDNYPQLVVSGGGGAFLHGSGVSARNVTYYGQHFQRRAWYPFGAKTLSLFRRVFGFRLINWKFDIFGGVIYTMLIFSLLPLSPKVQSCTDVDSIADFLFAVADTALDLIWVIFTETYFSATAAVGVTIVMLILINGKVPIWHRIPSGLFFGACHVICATLLVSFMHHAFEQMTIHKMILSTEDEWRSFLLVELKRVYNSTISGLEGWCKMDDNAKVGRSWWSYVLEALLEPIVDVSRWAESKTYISTPISFLIRSLDVTESFEYLRLRVTANTSQFGQFSPNATRLECVLYYGHFLWFYWLFATPAIACLLGFFLWFCVTVLSSGFDPAYSAFRIEDYKNFLRFRMSKKDGSLEVFVIGVDHVPRQWEADPKHLEEKERYHRVATEARTGNSAGAAGGSGEEVPPAHLWDRPSLWRPKKQRNLQQKFPWTYHGPRIVERFTLQPTPRPENEPDGTLSIFDSPKVTVMRRSVSPGKHV